MKSVFALAALMFSVSAFATTPVRHSNGPIQIDPDSRAAVQPVVKMMAGAGLVPPGSVAATKLVVGNDGSVEVTETTYLENGGRKTEKHDSLWYFEMDVMQKTEAAVKKLSRPAKLVDQNPKDPTYSDGLFISISVVVEGKDVVVARSSGGHTFLPADKNQARAAKYLLGNMTNLYRSVNEDRR